MNSFEEIARLKNLVAEKVKVIAVMEKERTAMQKLHRQYQKERTDQDSLENEYGERMRRVNEDLRVAKGALLLPHSLLYSLPRCIALACAGSRRKNAGTQGMHARRILPGECCMPGEYCTLARMACKRARCPEHLARRTRPATRLEGRANGCTRCFHGGCSHALRVAARCNKYKEIHMELEKQLAQEQAKAQKEADNNRHLKEKLRAIQGLAPGASEEKPFDPSSYKETLEKKDETIKKLEHDMQILKKAKQVADKQHAVKAKENRVGKDHYREQAEELETQLQHRTRELKENQVLVRKLQSQMRRMKLEITSLQKLNQVPSSCPVSSKRACICPGVCVRVPRRR